MMLAETAGRLAEDLQPDHSSVPRSCRPAARRDEPRSADTPRGLSRPTGCNAAERR